MNYAAHILTIKLWEWEAVKDSSIIQMAKTGHDEETVAAYRQSENRIQELKTAIEKIKE